MSTEAPTPQFDEQFPKTLMEAIRHFSDPDACMKFMVEIRWPGGHITCPRCQCDDIAPIKSRRVFRCRGCQKQFSVKVGTVFEDSPIGLDIDLPPVW